MLHPPSLRRSLRSAAALAVATGFLCVAGVAEGAGPATPAPGGSSAVQPVAPVAHGAPLAEVTSVTAGQVLPGLSLSAFSAGPTVAAHLRAHDAAAARAKAARAKARASRSAARTPRAVARSLASARGWGSQEFLCLDRLWSKESDWLVTADNPTSSAYGIPQALPGKKMASHGADWRTNPTTQIRWGLDYIHDVYGTPCRAWAHSRSVNWY